jgi:hypothetical protein
MDSSVVLFLGMLSAIILTYLVAKVLLAWFGRYDSTGIAKSSYNERLFYSIWVLLIVLVVYAVPQLVMKPQYGELVGRWKHARGAFA